MADHPDPITRLVRACKLGPLEPDDPRYVNCDDVRGENLVKIYERNLRRADPNKPEIKLFSGHQGVGKTSELKRLKGMLENPTQENQKPFMVIYFDVCDYLDPNDLDFPDLLVLIAAEVQKQLMEKKIDGFTLTSTYLKNVWNDLQGLLESKIAIKEVGVDVGFGSLALELRNRPNARNELREKIELLNTRLLDAVNDLLTNATTSLRAGGSEGLILIVDGLDKLIRRILDDGKTTTHERMFIYRSEQLAALQAHTVYTVPISLIYSEQCTQLEHTVGEYCRPIPMIRLRGDARSEPTSDTAGMKKMWEILEARCNFANVDIGEVFVDPATGHYLCEMSGGHPRHLMMFVQAAADQVDAFPITMVAAEKAVRNYANTLAREIPESFWSKLKDFDQPQSDIPKDEDHMMMLYLRHVFEYMNGEPWYEINPVIRTIRKYLEYGKADVL